MWICPYKEAVRSHCCVAAFVSSSAVLSVMTLSYTISDQVASSTYTVSTYTASRSSSGAPHCLQIHRNNDHVQANGCQVIDTDSIVDSALLAQVAQTADVIVCDLVHQAQASLQLAAAAAQHACASRAKVCIGISSPLVWARNKQTAPSDTADAKHVEAILAEASASESQNDERTPDPQEGSNRSPPREEPADKAAGSNAGEQDPDGSLPASVGQPAPSDSQPVRSSQQRPWTGTDYTQRKAAPKAQAIKLAEDMLLQRHRAGIFNTYVVCPGIVYGAGESDDGLHQLFKTAWEDTTGSALTMMGSGLNIVPTIHVSDLAAYICACADAKPDQQYLLAVDGASVDHNTHAALVKAVSEQLGAGDVVETDMAHALLQQACADC